MSETAVLLEEQKDLVSRYMKELECVAVIDFTACPGNSRCGQY